MNLQTTFLFTDRTYSKRQTEGLSDKPRTYKHAGEPTKIIEAKRRQGEVDKQTYGHTDTDTQSCRKSYRKIYLHTVIQP